MKSGHGRKNPRMLPVLLGAVLLLSGCTAPDVASSVPQYDYSCCSDQDVETIYSPDSTLSLHWIVTPTTVQTAAIPGATSLEAILYGPFKTAEDVKEDPHAGVGIKAPTLHPDVKAGSAETSEIAIPKGAEPGYYNLSFTVKWSPDFSTSGESIIRIQ
jgi:hypothetical protein